MKRQAMVHGGEAVGALIPDAGRFRFVAVKFSVWALDGRFYDSPEMAQRAVSAHFAGDLPGLAAVESLSEDAVA
ncbi:uncharacterized protein (DUF934 family) [Pararhizobium capsulatum DSM 1112]|uniref:Uncharacterized protein (DUF934 family) n=1 Tax=Pararhizobium capsulatum DSM 1112 TaxID=1121113 RepID=A0ABU0BMW0_9HYPH|nr:hypothetical protein [Pararhizobium capsulatum]MDQ0319253.1 uncharacterized protein (DUF934 family) [Pararhizobium capsulatum DSM 1112]